MSGHKPLNMSKDCSGKGHHLEIQRGEHGVGLPMLHCGGHVDRAVLPHQMLQRFNDKATHEHDER